MKFTLKKTHKFGWSGVDGWNYDFDDKVSVSYIEISKNIPRRKNTRNDRVYFILEGEAEFVIEGKKKVVKEKEVVRIPKKTTYSYKPLKKLRLVEVNIPPFDINSEIVLDK